MQVSEAMTRDVRIARPDQSIRDAALIMADIDAGVVPIGDNDRLVGVITDRDIAIRAIARGKGPDAKIADVMSSDIKYCFEDEEIDHVMQNLGDQQLRRLPVVSRDKRLVGILSLADIAVKASGGAAGSALSNISRPGGRHSQTGV
ncbi:MULTISPECIES: CBS domain-containing protein [unclassified Rhizobium]|uniref:CBS domain-containing protein n=1 Tax=unclassified Rhizobium TaxID=2613769 RepID=UPI000EA8EA6B|nr:MULTISPECIES: CBS domain-containing protein [unclassified Rhizobium]AYG69885.1 CBS domain-containing protein [Rhizobium sp. CCGE531]AYG76265.1 CBS domain-containing protein [Rhizobium sp. CCGE532]